MTWYCHRPLMVTEASGLHRIVQPGEEVDTSNIEDLDRCERLGLIGSEPPELEPAVDETPEEGEPPVDYGKLKLPALKDLAVERELQVEGTGKGGKLLKKDLVAALAAADETE